MSDKQQPAVEEVSLGQSKSAPAQAAKTHAGAGTQTDAPADAQADAPGLMSARTVNLENIVGPASTNAALVDAILEATPERLIPWESCRLPSLSLYYGWDVDSVEVRGMSQIAEKFLANQRLAQTGESIDYLFRECVRFPDQGFDSMDLLVGDRVFLLYYLRGITHGNEYEFAVTCQRQDCNHTSTHRYDLNNLASTIKWADPTLGNEPFKVDLPYLSEAMRRPFWVEIRFLRGRDTNNLVAMRRTKRRAFATTAIRAGKNDRGNSPFDRPAQGPVIDDALSENLELIIQSIMGVTDRTKIGQFVREKLHATDSAAIREWIRDHSPGIETAITMNCPECGQEMTMDLPLQESFFRPTQKR